MINLVLDADFTKAAGIDEKRLSPVRERVYEFRKLMYRTEKAVFERKIESVREEIQTKLSKDELVTLRNSFRAGEFYKMGPVEFAKSIDLGTKQCREIRKNAVKYAPKLEQKLRDIENEFLTRYFALFRDKELRAVLQNAVKNCSPNRFGTPSILWRSLHGLDSEFKAKGQSKKGSQLQTYAIATAGYLSPITEFRPEPFNDFSTLLTAQPWEINEDASNRLLLNLLQDRRLELQRQYMVDRKNLEQDFVFDKNKLNRQIEQLNEQYYENKKTIAAEIIQDFTVEEQKQFDACRFLSLVQRIGPVKALESSDCRKLLGFSIEKPEVAATASKAKEIENDLKRACETLQTESIKAIFGEIESSDRLQWANSPYPYAVPPLEVLLHHCRRYQR